MKECELCDRPARMYCESDQASLCWDCDAKVHGANFLVARHSRSLLCRTCQAPTPWKASGSRLGPTVSVCERCMGTSGCDGEKVERGGEEGSEVDGDDDEEEEEEEEDEDEDEEVEEEEEDGDNQVVPWSLAMETMSNPPPVASSSSSDESSSSRVVIYNAFYKRMRENADPASSQDDLGCSPSQPGSYFTTTPLSPLPSHEDEATSPGGSFCPPKDRKKAAHPRSAPAQQAAGSLKRLQQDHPSRADNLRAVDLVSFNCRSPPI